MKIKTILSRFFWSFFKPCPSCKSLCWVYASCVALCNANMNQREKL
jgi:hypothetical protein